MTKEYHRYYDLKNIIGQRFKKFRKIIKKNQYELAKELCVYQSTVTNFEVGKTFPGIKYLKYFQDHYELNLNWLINGIDGMFVEKIKKPAKYKSYLFSKLEPSDPRLERFQELIDLLEIPGIEYIIFGRLTEIKLLAKEEIEKFHKMRISWSGTQMAPTALLSKRDTK